MAQVVISASQKASITRAVNLLNKVRREIQNENPDFDINWYLEDSGNFMLLETNSHDDNGVARMDSVIVHHLLNNSGGGVW